MDSASPELGRARHAVRVAHSRLMDRLQGLLNRYGASLQENIITQREGRYVIPVRVSERSRVAGIVHDMSSSGQTVFIEPLEIVEAANAWREAQVAEQHEVERILLALSAA